MMVNQFGAWQEFKPNIVILYPIYQLFIYLYTYIGEGNGTPLQYSCLENPMEGGA